MMIPKYIPQTKKINCLKKLNNNKYYYLIQNYLLNSAPISKAFSMSFGY